MSDIVKKLRDCANGVGDFETERGDFGLCDDAADLIERLDADASERRSLTAELVEALDQAEALLRNGPRFETTDDERFLQPIRSRDTAERIAALLSRARAKEDT